MAIADGAVIVLTDGIGVVATVEIRLVLAYYRELYGPDTNTPMRFDLSHFFNGLGVNGWVSDQDELKNNPFAEFDEKGYLYRSYYPDNTFFYARGGALSSVKIDAITDNRMDDHLVMQAIFDPHGNLFAVAGSIDIFSVKSISNYIAPASGVFAYNAEGKIIHVTQGGEEVTEVQGYASLEEAYANSLKDALRKTGVVYGINITDRQATLVDASVKVLAAMGAAIG